MQFLQDNLERLSTACKLQVANYTESSVQVPLEEAEHVELNPLIMHHQLQPLP